MKYFTAILLWCLVHPGHNLNSYLSNKDVMNESHDSKFLTNFLQKFRGFHIIFHSSPDSLVYVSNVAQQINLFDEENEKGFAYSSLIIYSHDEFVDSGFERPKVSKVVNVLFDFDEDLWDFLATPQNIKANDVIVFYDTEELKDRLQHEGEKFLRLAGNILVIQPNVTHINIFKTCFYCGENSKKFFLLESTNDTNTKIEMFHLLPSNFRNLNGHVLHLVFISYFPVVECEGTANITMEPVPKYMSSMICTDIQGIEGILMRVMSNKLNFRFVIHLMSPNAMFFNMIQLVHEEVVDLAFGGISMTAERIPLVQFTKVYNFEQFNFLYIFDLTFREIFDNFMAPFSAGLVWTLYFSAFFAFSLTLYVALKLRVEDTFLGISFPESLWNMLHVVIEQSNPDLRGLYRGRASCGLALASWWLGSLVVATAYKSGVLSAMVHPPNREPPDLRALVRAGYRFAGNAQTADTIAELLTVNDPLYREALRKTMYGENTCDVFTMMLNKGHIAMLDEQSTIQYEVRSTCAAPRATQIARLRMCRTAVRYTGHAWATRPGAPFTPALNRYLSLVFSAGLFKKWTSDVTLKFAKNQIRWAREKQSGEIKTLSLKVFLPLLTIYAMGIAIATLCFILETTYFHLKNGNQTMKFLCDCI